MGNLNGKRKFLCKLDIKQQVDNNFSHLIPNGRFQIRYFPEAEKFCCQDFFSSTKNFRYP